jgi:hypothetical protein
MRTLLGSSAMVERSLWGGNASLDGPNVSRDIAQDGAHVFWLVANLLVSEAQRREPGGSVHLVAHVIARLLSRSVVVEQAVGLYNQSQVWPQEVDLEAVDPGFRFRHRQADVFRKRQKEPLEARASETEGAPVEPPPQTGHPWLTAVMHELGPEHRGREEPKPIRLVDHALHGQPVVAGGEVDQSLRRAGHRDSIKRPDRIMLKPPATMDAEARLPPIPSRTDCDLYLLTVLRPDSKQSRRAAVAQNSSEAARQHRRHPSTPLGEAGTAHGINTAEDRMQPSLRDPVVNGMRAETKCPKLLSRQNPMLIPHQSPSTRDCRARRLLS